MYTLTSSTGVIIDITEDRREDYRKELADLLKDKDFEKEAKSGLSLGDLDEFIAMRGSIIAIGIERFLQKKGYKIQTIRILKAHSEPKRDNWYFVERKQGSEIYIPIASWIGEHDGNYDALIISACNRFKQKPKAKRSIVVFPNGLSSDKRLMSVFLEERSNFAISEPEEKIIR